MTQFACQCGHNISLSSAPNPNDGRLIWDDGFEQWQSKRGLEIAKFISLVLKGNKKDYIREFYKTDSLDDMNIEDVIEDIITKTDTHTLGMVRCDSCNRIYIQEKHGLNKYKCYLLE